MLKHIALSFNFANGLFHSFPATAASSLKSFIRIFHFYFLASHFFISNRATEKTCRNRDRVDDMKRNSLRWVQSANFLLSRRFILFLCVNILAFLLSLIWTLITNFSIAWHSDFHHSSYVLPKPFFLRVTSVNWENSLILLHVIFLILLERSQKKHGWIFSPCREFFFFLRKNI